MKKCKYCQTEIDDKATICPTCTKPQSNKLKNIIGISIGLVLVMAIILSGMDNTLPNNTVKETNNLQNTNNVVIDPKGETITLSTGEYIAGKDIKLGKYDLIAQSGNGNISVKSSYNLKVNEMFGIGIEGYDQFYTKTFNNLKLENNDTISISGTVSILFQAK
jgi:hypothetical protein